MPARISGLGVVVAAVVHFGLGALWFTLFATPWVAGLGMTPEQVQAAHQNPTPWPYFVALLCSFAMAYALAWIVGRMDRPGLMSSIMAGLVVGVVIVAAMLTEYGFERRSYRFAFIAAGYPLLGSILMGAIAGAFRRRLKTGIVAKTAA